MDSPADLFPASPAYPDTLTIQPLARPPHAIIQVPGSKSVTNRALILAALAEGTSELYGALDADDTRVMMDALNRLGIRATWEPEDAGMASPKPRCSTAQSGSPDTADTSAVQPPQAAVIRVHGQGGRIPVRQAELFVGNSGTSIRFLTALCALGRGPYTLDGVARMRERPQQDLLAALSSLGVDANAINGDGCAPLRVQSRAGGMAGGATQLRAEASSQYLSALLMAAPYAHNDVDIHIVGALRPSYVDMTQRMMAEWGVNVANPNPAQFHVTAGQRYAPQQPYYIEPDASSASYFLAAAAVTGGRVTIYDLYAGGLQGDAAFAHKVLEPMGCTVWSDDGKGSQGYKSIDVTGPPGGRLRGIDIDMGRISDTALTLAAIAPFADTPTTVRGIAHSRQQECDRVSAVCAELTRLGVQVEEHGDGYTIYPAASIRPGVVQTYSDHRVAMSFALVGLRAHGVTIADPGCVAKTFPGYWQTLDQLRR